LKIEKLILSLKKLFTMKKLKKSILVLIILILLLALGVFLFLYFKKPSYEGEVIIKNIEKSTTVYFDEYGIPHIYASSQKDAMTVLGYVHAQDRLWQMELIRRIAPGRLSEVFGEKALENDLFFAGIGINENSEEAVKKLDKNSETYILANAYLDGINQFLENGKTPLEYELTGVVKEKFTLKDIYNTVGYMAFSFAMAQKTDPLISEIQAKFGNEYLKDLGIDGSFGTTQIKNYKEIASNYSEISQSIASLLDVTPVAPFIGSNSWVIGSAKTKNGKVIFANDPHIAFSQPCTWYEAHINVPNYEIYGYFLAGVPFPLLGHNRDYAYGLTMFENDDVDFFQETENPNNIEEYQAINGFLKFENSSKTIKVKDSSDVALKIKKTIHGPVVNKILNTIKTKEPIAMSWEYLKGENKILEALYSLSHAKNVEDFKNNLSLIHAPGLNVMYGDAQNNIAWITSGRLYQLDASVNPNLILDGSNEKHNVKNYLPFSKNPSAVNPSWNYVYSANNQTEAIDGYLYPGYYLPKDRGSRIVQLLENKNDWTREDVSQMILDNTSVVGKDLMLQWIAFLNQKEFNANEKQAISYLQKWTGSHNLQDIAPVIYNKWIYQYLKNTYEDELGTDNFNLFISTHIVKQTITNQSVTENSPWWDNISTPQKETRNEVLQKSFKEAILSLENQLGSAVNQWTWNKVHTLEHEHPIGKIAAMRSYFNVGPFEIAGSNEVINNLLFSYSDSGIYKVKAGPSTRRIIDFSDVENSISILPTGQSGVPGSPHYKDQSEMYVAGKFRKMKLNKKEIVETSRKMVFKSK
jgi:penicillin G amidase